MVVGATAAVSREIPIESWGGTAQMHLFMINKFLLLHFAEIAKE